jgi:soluble lytic murein transglycosylase-like protein
MPNRAFDPTAKNSDPKATAAGLLGLTNPAIKEMHDKFGGYEGIDKLDATQNIVVSTFYLRHRIRQARGNLVRALAGYGTGIGYAHRIINAANALKTSDNPMATLRGYLGK